MTPELKLPKLKFQSGPEIRAYRRNLGLSQTEFWEPIGVTQSGSSRYESGRDVPWHVLVVLHLAYGTPKQAEVFVSRLRENAGKI